MKLGLAPSQWLGSVGPPDWVDRMLIIMWLQINERVCPSCGRPLSLHKEEVETLIGKGYARDDAERKAAREYHTPYLTCPAAMAIEVARAEKHDDSFDAADRKAGREPESWRTWLTWTDLEGAPDFSEMEG